MVVENGPTDPIPQVKEEGKVILVADYLSLCHGSAGTPLETHAGRKALGLQDARTAIRT
jgi:hypothetical protein